MAGRCGTVLLVLVAGVALGGDRRPDAVPREPEFVARVNAAIDRGVGWLRKAQQRDGGFPDFPNFPGATTALAYHTLRACGVGRDDASARRAWDHLRRAYAEPELHTYSAAMYLLAISVHVERMDGARADGQVRPAAADVEWASSIARLLVDGQKRNGTWGYNVGGRGRMLAEAPDYYDHSNTQCALLGLQCAARCGVHVDPAVWSRSLEHFVAAQEASGPPVARDGTAPARAGADAGRTRDTAIDHARGWSYKSCEPSTAEEAYRIPKVSSTAAGVSSIAICRDGLLAAGPIDAKLDAASTQAAWDGLAWIGARWEAQFRALRTPAIPEATRGRLLARIAEPYDCYSVERAGVLAGVERMAGLDWYGDGARALLEAQAEDGSWAGSAYPGLGGDAAAERSAARPVDTCFALLFLRRATVPTLRGAVTQGGADDDINFAVAAKLEGKDLADFLDLVLARWRRASDEAVKTRLFDGATSAGPRIVEPLLVRMDAADSADRAAAHALLRQATGQDFGFVTDAAADAREAALAKWQTWWMTSKGRLVYDAGTRRLVAR